MKFLVISALMVFAQASFAGDLDGSMFCRTVNMGGAFGQPAGEGLHCVSFEADVMRDNANTFFGNPPTTKHYEVEGSLMMNKGVASGYEIVGETIVMKESGAVLVRK